MNLDYAKASSQIDCKWYFCSPIKEEREQGYTGTKWKNMKRWISKHFHLGHSGKDIYIYMIRYIVGMIS